MHHLLPARWAMPFALLSLSLAVSQALAQMDPSNAPSAGDLERFVSPPLQAPTRPADERAVQQREQPKPGTQNEGPRIEVAKLVITGNTVFRTEELDALVAEVPGKSWSLADLQDAVYRITAYYQNAGYGAARAILPAQEIRDGVVQVLVVEGRIGKVNIDNRSLIRDAQVAALAGRMPAGSVVFEPSLERRLLLLGETPGASRATVLLKPGAQTGETDLDVTVEPGSRVTGLIEADTHGNRYTGYNRVGATVNVNSPAGLGDQVQLRLLATDENLRQARLGYRVPVGGSGWVVGASWSDLHYKLGREYEPLKASGWARVGTVQATYPLWRSVEHTAFLTTSFERKNYEDRFAPSEPALVNRKHSRVAGIGLNGYGLVGNATYSFAALSTHGQLVLENEANRAVDAQGLKTHGGFSKFVLTSNITAPVSGNWSLYGSAYTQLASQNLDSSERLSLGGMQGVRAYPQGEATGDEGYIASGEVRYTLPLQAVQLAGFVDFGQIWLNRHPLPDTENRRILRGTGLSLLWSPQPTTVVRVTVATRLGDERIVSELSNARTRWWLQGVWRY